MGKNILVINPNTSLEMTKSIRRAIKGGENDRFDITVKSVDFGPESLESFYDYNLAVIGLYKSLLNKKLDYDGVLLACFGDPGLYSLKEKLTVPVIGIAEASLSLSLLLGQSFSILTALPKAVPMMKDMVQQYGLRQRCQSIKSLNLSVLDVEKNKDEAINRIIKVGNEALKEGAEVLVLGCAGMTGIKKEIVEELDVPVIDPIMAGLELLKSVLKTGFFISKKGLYKTPPVKNIKGDINFF